MQSGQLTRPGQELTVEVHRGVGGFDVQVQSSGSQPPGRRLAGLDDLGGARRRGFAGPRVPTAALEKRFANVVVAAALRIHFDL